MDPLKRIADETEEDYQTLEKILKDAGVQTYRSFLNMDKVVSLKNIAFRPPVCPRDHFGVIGEKLYAIGGKAEGYGDLLKQIHRKNLVLDNQAGVLSTAAVCRVGKDIWWDVDAKTTPEVQRKYQTMLEQEGFRVHISARGYHNDGAFCVVKPGCIVSLMDIQNYTNEFPGWDVLYLPDQSWSKVSPFLNMKEKVGGKWWLKGEEHNDQLIQFVNSWLNDWVGYVEETVFDVNMLSLDQNTIICNNHNKEVFSHFKKHKVEPIVFNFRHRYFWDGGVHCITQDLYREGTQEDYFG
jgi:N-dimethylarginine dimethylaminohydrolase